MDPTYYDNIAGRTRALLILLEDRLAKPAAELVSEFIDHAEYGLAVEQMAALLTEANAQTTEDERAVIRELSDAMGGLELPSGLV